MKYTVKHSHPALPPGLWQVYMALLYGKSIRPIQALTTCRTATAHAQALLGGGGLDVRGEVWFGSFFKRLVVS